MKTNCPECKGEGKVETHSYRENAMKEEEMPVVKKPKKPLVVWPKVQEHFPTAIGALGLCIFLFGACIGILALKKAGDEEGVEIAKREQDQRERAIAQKELDARDEEAALKRGVITVQYSSSGEALRCFLTGSRDGKTSATFTNSNSIYLGDIKKDWEVFAQRLGVKDTSICQWY
jgi:hypothetical protein